MKRHITLIILLAAYSMFNVQCSMIWAQPRFVPDTDIKKVGEVEFQVPRHFSLGFTNKGDKPLIIKEAKASCGCLDVVFPQTPVAAGSRGEISLTFDAKLLGSFYKEVEVLTNASDKPSYVAIQGTVVTEVHDYSAEFPIDLGNVRLVTNTVEFEDVNRGDHPTAELRLLNSDRTAFRPELMHLPPYLSAEYLPEDIPAGKAGTIRLTLDNIAIYERPIKVYEGNKLEIRDGKIFINDQEAREYTFKMDYYWMQGDNRHNSADSRYWGFVPEDHIVGKPIFIWWSSDPDHSGIGGIRWSRLGRIVDNIK